MVLMTVFVAISNAKEQPPQTPVPRTVIDRVMREFSQLIGATVSIGNIGKYFATTVTTSSNECPQSQYKIGNGYTVVFVWRGITFDYRVDLAVTHVVLCSMRLK